MNSQALVNATLRDKINRRSSEAQPSANRFQPTEKPRGVVQKTQTQPQEIAGEVGFKPVAQVSVQNSNLSVRAVRNTESRPISAAVVDQGGRVAVLGERVIELGSNLHDQIKAKVNTEALFPKAPTTSHYVAPHDFNVEKTASPQAGSSAENKAYNQTIKQQLEEINKVLFEQIKQKIAQELQRQRSELTNPALQPKALPQKQNPEATVLLVDQPNTLKNPSLPNLGSQKQVNPLVSKTEVGTPFQAPVISSPAVKIEDRPKTPEKVLLATPATPIVGIVKPLAVESKPQISAEGLDYNPQEYKNHISKLETEIDALTKEVAQLDGSLGQLEQENHGGELSALEQKIEVDQRMLKAVADWRLSLNNLINSHTLALKYLKQKVDWLQTKVQQMDSHSHKHDNFHKSLLANAEFPTLSPGFSELDTLAKEVSSPVKKPLEQIDSENRLAEREHQQVDAEEKASLKAVLKEALAESQAEHQQHLVAENLKDKPVSQLAPANPEMVVPQQAANLPAQNPAITAPIEVPQEPDIERQILEAATAEENLKESVKKTREDEIRKVAQEAAQKHLAQADSKDSVDHAVNQAINSVAPEIIKSEFEKIKSGLTRIDDKNLENLSNEDRGEMMHKLNTLEKQTLVAKQFDELKAASERKRINAELQAMLTRLGERPTSTPITQEANSARPEQKIETLKIQEKQKKTPEQKAKIIAEIKDLERQSQARKTASMSRPVVKAQPAFGKMLPNTPTVPNVINGIVKDNKGLLLATVVLIVKDKNADPVRAFKTNKIGQFALSTPVPNGTYTLELEKEGYEFDIIEIEVSGEIMQPIEIKAR